MKNINNFETINKIKKLIIKHFKKLGKVVQLNLHALLNTCSLLNYYTMIIIIIIV